jgi:hypothetical protein
VTPDEAISKWRSIKTLEELDYEYRTNPQFVSALNEAGRLALESGDPLRKFWEVDATGWRKNQFNVAIPPARPDTRDEHWNERMKPIPGAAFPS